MSFVVLPWPLSRWRRLVWPRLTRPLLVSEKRFSLTKTGKVKRAMTKKRHLLNGHGKTTKLKRALRGTTYADKTNEAAIKRMILYK